MLSPLGISFLTLIVCILQGGTRAIQRPYLSQWPPLVICKVQVIKRECFVGIRDDSESGHFSQYILEKGFVMERHVATDLWLL